MDGQLSTDAAPNAKSPAKRKNGDENARRYAMQREAQKTMSGLTYTRKHGGETRESSYRITRCHRNPNLRVYNPGVDVVHYPDHDRYGYGNLVSCGSVWHCPICAPKITEYRRIELSAAIVEVKRSGGEAFMLTLTYRHDCELPLDESVRKFYKARSSFTASQAFKETMKDIGAIGRIFSTEVTWGQNGWHPHLHMLILAEQDGPDVLARIESLRDYWGRHVFKAGLGLINEHGFDVQNGDYAAEYVAKYGREPKQFTWSASHELAKSHAKIAKGENLTPFGMLDLLASKSAIEIGSRIVETEELAKLFREYAVEFQGRQQLFWSPGLRDKLGIEAERSDEEIAAGEGERDVIGTLTLDEWREVLRLNARGQILSLLARHGRDALPRIKAMLPSMKARHPDEPYFSEEKRFRSY